MLVAVGWTGDGANAPGCINPMGKCLVAPPEHVLPSEQQWDRDRAQLCTAEGGLLPGTMHHYDPAMPQSVKLHSEGKSNFSPPLVHEDHSNVLRALPASF